MRLLFVTLVLVHTVQVVVGPPVTANKKSESDKKEEEHNKGADWVSFLFLIISTGHNNSNALIKININKQPITST
jgi:hypothetical protein